MPILLQLQDFFLDQADGFQECFIALSAGVLQTPVLPMEAGQEGALDIAAHGDDHIHLRDVGKELAVLGGFHIDAVDLLHQPDRIGVDPGLGFRTGRIAFKHIACQLLSQGFCDLAAAGIMDTDKGYFFHYSFSFALILQIIWVMVPMGQKLHQVLGLNRVFTARPIMVEVSMTL